MWVFRLNQREKVGILLIILIISVALIGYSMIQSIIPDTDENNFEIEGTYSQHDSIYINSDSDFVEQGWPGNGSVTNPYVIEGLNVSYSYDSWLQSAISIKHTTVYFEIRNCLLMLPYANPFEIAIRFENVSYGTVMNCFLINYEYGSFLEDSNNCIVFNNTAFSTGYYEIRAGFGLQDSINCTIMKNEVKKAIEGYSIYRCNNCSVTSNSVSDIKHSAVSLWYSNCCIVQNNKLGETGIGLWGRSEENWNHEMTNNTLNKKPIGYFKEFENVVIDGSLYGQIILAKCENVTVEGLESPHAVFGVNLGFCIGCSVEQCNSFDNYANGFSMLFCINCIINQCRAVDILTAYELEYCCGCALTNNIADSNVAGYSLREAKDCILSNNIAISNVRGFLLYHVNNSTMMNNTAMSNTEEGINFYESNNCIVVNNTITDNKEGGLSIGCCCDDNVIYYNRFARNGQYNAADGGYNNRWDDGISCGNYWDDWNGTGPYFVSHIGNRCDNFPQLWIQQVETYDIAAILVLSCIGLVITVVVAEEFIRKKHSDGNNLVIA